MTSSQLVPLASVATINPALGTTELAADELVDFVPMAAVEAGASVTASKETRPYQEVKNGYTYFADGDILMAKITPCFENGKISQIRTCSVAGFGSTEFHVIRAQPEKLDARYLVHFLRQERVRIEGEKRMTGSAGQRRVPKSFLESLPVYLPSLSEQRRIAAILDKADALRTKRRDALAQLDRLAQSIFVEMFGEPVTNPKGWPMSRIGDLLESASYGTSEKSDTSGQFPVLRMNNITRTGEMDFSDLKYMDLDASEQKRYLVKAGDVLFNRTNSAELVGKTGIFRETAPMAYAGYLIRLRTNADNDPEYLAAFLNTPYAKRVLRSMCKSIIGMANINATEVQGIKIAQPPMALQVQFRKQIQSLNQVKASHREILTELDALFSSLQYRAFRGEL